jgi:diacylglycerol O-acyltransferase-1
MVTSTSTMTDTSVATAVDLPRESDLHRRKSSVPSVPEANGATKRARDTKYRHVFATHAQHRESCLSHDSDTAPSFVGFRNLMVLVLSRLVATARQHR